MSSKDNMRQILEGIIGNTGGDGATIERLVRENEALKSKLRDSEATIQTLRKSKLFYQEIYRKAKAAYEKLRGINNAPA